MKHIRIDGSKRTKMSKKLTITYALLITGFFGMLFPKTSQAMMNMGFTGEVNAQEEHGETLDKIIPELLLKYNVNDIKNLNCDEVSDEDMEALGEAVMSERHPDSNVHEQMDEMMGGEGSESLKAAHINMARGYLGCTNRVSNDDSMMGGEDGMMGWGMPMYGGSRAFGSFGILSSVLGVATWLALIAFLAAGARWFWKKSQK